VLLNARGREILAVVVGMIDEIEEEMGFVVRREEVSGVRREGRTNRPRSGKAMVR